RGPTPEDPRAMEQRYVIAALFGGRNGMLGRSLEGVDRNQLIAAVRAGLRNEDGRTRGCLASVYANLPYAEMTPLLPDVHKAILENSPSGEMFDGQIQTAGLEMLSKNRVDEGIELIANYVRLQKRHGSENHIVKILGLLEPYGAHAQRAIPLLEKAVYYFENEETDFPKDGSLKKAALTREAIAKIRAATAKPELVKLAL
ncbi:MAG TPA: hypothetical protein VFY13_06410, partial [Luteolibacter sp.]|nr:hypothetical protein [Luteolibacter sp.]